MIPEGESQGSSNDDESDFNQAISDILPVLNESCSVAQYHEAFKSGKTTPLKVAETLLDLIEASPAHQKAFLSIKRAEVLAAAEESTSRYVANNYLSIVDGLPVGVKDEVDLDGHDKTLGTSKAGVSPKGTSWCVTRWQKAGAIVVGKLNMHEVGLGTC